jgi:lipopolysaccharide transport system ATP-binding protein
MNEFAIRAEELGKEYRIGGAARASYTTLRETLTNALSTASHRLRRFAGQRTRSAVHHGGPSRNRFWALKDLTFDVRAGEVVGIIGRNGAGKSTLLKIISRITEPTRGEVRVYGRVGSLLEVGTGFHPELTGRENIILNGAILGMTRREILKKFDAIVDFAEVERFVDTAVKHYSSGMYLRLAFAVAAHLEPEVLLVDEVLAVGDAAFQKKCLGKMHDVSKDGRTILFVSHNLPAITGLCDRVILLDEGTIRQVGDPHHVVSTYLTAGLSTTAEREWTDSETAPCGEVARLRAVRIRTEDGQIAESVDIRQPIRIELEFEVLKPGYRLMPHFWLTNEAGIEIFSTHDVDPTWRQKTRPQGRFVSTVLIPGNFLADGAVYVSAGCISVNPVVNSQFQLRDVVVFRVVDTFDTDTARGDYPGRMDGVVRPLLNWTTEFEPPNPRIRELTATAGNAT